MPNWAFELANVKATLSAQCTESTSAGTVLNSYAVFMKSLARARGTTVVDILNEAIFQFLYESAHCAVAHGSGHSGQFGELNDDCVKLALSCLTLSERCAAERSCKRLCNVSRELPLERERFADILLEARNRRKKWTRRSHRKPKTKRKQMQNENASYTLTIEKAVFSKNRGQVNCFHTGQFGEISQKRDIRVVSELIRTTAEHLVAAKCIQTKEDAMRGFQRGFNASPLFFARMETAIGVALDRRKGKTIIERATVCGSLEEQLTMSFCVKSTVSHFGVIKFALLNYLIMAGVLQTHASVHKAMRRDPSVEESSAILAMAHAFDFIRGPLQT